MSAAWDKLNERQQTYLHLIFVQDQIQEQAENYWSAQTWRSRPAHEWRKIEYADTYSGHTALKQAIKGAGLVDHGTGSTFNALHRRGYIQVAYVHPLSSEVDIWLTAKGRKLVRRALDISTRRTLPVGTLREWHWRALCRAYTAGDAGFYRDDGPSSWYHPDRPQPFGFVSWKTILRLRDYRVKGEDRPLVREGRGEPFSLIITEFGKAYYQEHWQEYRERYPDVEAPDPHEKASKKKEESEDSNLPFSFDAI